MANEEYHARKQKNRYFSSYESFVQQLPPEYAQEVKEQYARGSFQRLLTASILFFCIISISLLRDMLTGFYHRPEEPYNFFHLIAFGWMLAATVTVIVCGLLHSRKPLSVHTLVYLHFFFYICINIALGLFMFNEFYRGYYTNYEQFYWLFFAFVPLLHLRSNVINMLGSLTMCIAEYTVVMVLHGNPFWDLLYIVPVFLCMEFFGMYLRRYYLKNIIFDIQNRLLQSRLKVQSTVDPLTGCYNRYALQEQFDQLCAENDKLSLFMFDIDLFKVYNDTFSHVEGDKCLSQISDAVKALCQADGMELYRYGGEEFIVLAKAMDQAELEKTALALLATVRALKIETPALKQFGNIVTISVGAATVDTSLSLKEDISLVDAQLYQAKEHGRNCAAYQSTILQEQQAATC